MSTDQPLFAGVPWFGARRFARQLQSEFRKLTAERDRLREQLEKLGVLTLVEMQERRRGLEAEIGAQKAKLDRERAKAAAEAKTLEAQIHDLRRRLVVTEETALLQEAGVYTYRHPLSDAVAYQKELAAIADQIKEMTKKDGGAVVAATDWTVNGSTAEGRKMLRDFSKPNAPRVQRGSRQSRSRAQTVQTGSRCRTS